MEFLGYDMNDPKNIDFVISMMLGSKGVLKVIE